MIETLDDRLEKLEQDYPDARTRARRNFSRRAWFVENAMQSFFDRLGSTPTKCEEIKSYIFDTLEASSEKIKAVKDELVKLLEEWLSKDFVRGIMPLIVGSTGRYEAEPGKDVDLDFVIDTSCVTIVDAQVQIPDLMKLLTEALERLTPRKYILLKLSEVERPEIYAVEELCDSNRGIDHCTNLIIGSQKLWNEDKMSQILEELRNNTDRRLIVRELKQRTVKEIDKRRPEPVKLSYFITTCASRMLALNYLTYEDVDKNYWKICELLIGRIDDGLWEDLARIIIELIYLRHKNDRKERISVSRKEELLSDTRILFTDLSELKADEID